VCAAGAEPHVPRMADTTTCAAEPPRSRAIQPASLLAWAGLALFAGLIGAFLVFFAVHARHLLAYPYPLDYGEGPLLAQANALRAGTPLWRLYADPAAPPYLVVNYPPLFPALAAALAPLAGGALPAGRAVSLLAGLGCALAIWRLSAPVSERWTAGGGWRTQPPPPAGTLAEDATGVRAAQRLMSAARLLAALSFLALPIVREWSAVMRVDMPGVCLGLWGLVCIRAVGTKGQGLGVVDLHSADRVSQIGGRAGARPHAHSSVVSSRSWLLWLGALLFVLSLYTKQSLVAAPGAAVLWLLALRRWREALLLGLLVSGLGGVLMLALHLASGGWFAVHLLTANVNAWEWGLAAGFWRGQAAILWPLPLAAALGGGLALARGGGARALAGLALLYALLGLIAAVGIGKVGAYLNYFLELYAGLICLVALAFADGRRKTKDKGRTHAVRRTNRAAAGAADAHPASVVHRRWARRVRLAALPSCVLALVSLALGRYYPVWSEEYLKPYGLVEQQAPPRIAFGSYGVWADLRREADVLATLGRVNAALVAEVRAAGGPILTDVPGIAAEAGQLSRIQAFEHRQLLDAGAWDQRPLLRDLANGRVPLVALDYLGNWLTPEMIALITYRYAQDGSRGPYDLYRPIDIGPPAPRDLPLADGLRLAAAHLAPAAGGAAYAPGETLLLTLEIGRSGAASPPAGALRVALLDPAGAPAAQASAPLFYGALAPADIPGDEAVQHLQRLPLPGDLAPGRYRLQVSLNGGAARDVMDVTIAGAPAPRMGRFGYAVPPAMLAAWRAFGGEALLGEPQMPAVPLPGGALQCFARGCLRLGPGGAERLPLGELVALGDSGVRFVPAAEPQGALRELWLAHGGAAVLGPAITGEIRRRDRVVQYTRYARLELPLNGDPPRLAPLGAEYLKLPGGGPYRGYAG
jgi:hypothetical protein